MFLGALNFFTLHAGIPVTLSQVTLTIMLVVLGIVLMGIGFAHISKTQTSLRQHRWTLTAAVILSIGTIFLVMVPAFFIFYIDPDLQLLSPLSITALIHSAIGIPAIVSAVIYVFGDLPANIRKWMRITASLWIATVIIGVVLFLQMLSLL
jgi:uncharacterized membrane protein YozB (DUF420 family)